MRRMVWVTPLINGGWRQHKPGQPVVCIENQTREEAIQKAKDVLKKSKKELDKLPYKFDYRKWCGRDPFPPRYEYIE